MAGRTKENLRKPILFASVTRRSESSVRAILTRAPIALPLAGSHIDSEAHPFSHRSLGVAVDRYGLVVLRKGTSGRVDISLHGQCPEDTFRLVADAVECFHGDALRRAGVELSLSAPGELGVLASSAIAVALVGAISEYLHLGMSRGEIGREAERIHARSLGWSGGWEHCSAHGGIQFLCGDGVETQVEPVGVMPGLSDTLNRRLLLFSSGDSAPSVPPSEWDTPGYVRVLHNLRAVAEEMRVALEETNLDLFGKLLDLGWSHERSLPGRPPFGRIEAGYCAALDAGASGGRAVSSNLLMLYGSRIAQETIEHTMAALGWQKVAFQFDMDGVQSSDGSGVAPWQAEGEITEREVRSWSVQPHHAI